MYLHNAQCNNILLFLNINSPKTDKLITIHLEILKNKIYGLMRNEIKN